MRTTITSLPCEDAYNSTVTINGLAGGYIPQLSIKAQKDKGQEYLLQILNSPNLRIGQLTVVGEPDDTNKETWMKTVASGVTSLSKDVVIEHLVVTDIHVGVSLRESGCIVKKLTVNRCSGDAWQIAADYCKIESWRVTNMLEVFPYDMQHSDVGQLFTRTVGDALIGVEVGPGELIKGGHKWEHQSPQGILATDCVPTACTITRAKLNGVHPQHGISLYNAVNCKILGTQTNGTVTAPGGSGNIIAGTLPPLDEVPNVVNVQKDYKGKTPFQIAQLEQGVTEIKGAKDNQRIVEYFTATSYHATDDETPWCAAFMCWCFAQAGKPHTKSAAAMSWSDWGVKLEKPELHCVIVADYDNGRGHVAFYLGEDATHYTILGGNQSDQVKVIRMAKSHAVRWHFRKSKSSLGSKTNLSAAAQGTLGAGTAGVGGYSMLVPTHPDEPAEPAAPISPSVITDPDGEPLTCEMLKCPVSIIPDGMVIVPEAIYYFAIAVGAAIFVMSMGIIKERIKKITEHGL